MLQTLGLVVVLLLWFFGSLEVALWGTFALVCVLFSVPVQLVATTTLTLLGMIVVTQLIPAMSGYSEKLAVYVFHLLVITVILQLRSLGDDDELEDGETVWQSLTLDLRNSLQELTQSSRSVRVQSATSQPAQQPQRLMRHHDIKRSAL